MPQRLLESGCGERDWELQLLLWTGVVVLNRESEVGVGMRRTPTLALDCSALTTSQTSGKIADVSATEVILVCVSFQQSSPV